MRGVFVTGTDTGVGKTVVAGAICAALAARGQRVAAFKPAVTGIDEPADDLWPRDHELLAQAAAGGQTADDVTPYLFGPPLSPDYAARLAETAIDPAHLRERACQLSAGADVLVCEGVGGLLVPLTERYSVRELAADLDLPVVVVARTGLGTINHTRLTVEAARAAGLDVVGIVMTPWSDPKPIEESNRATVEHLTGVRVSVLGPTTPASLASAGASLPLDEWL